MLMCPSSALHRSSWNSQPYTSANVRRCSHSQLHLKGTSQMPLPRGTRFHRPACQHKAMASAIIEDRTLMVKMSLAKGSGRLDLSWLGLHEIPDEIFDLPDLEELTLAGNFIKSLPAKLTKFKSLRRLQVAGNQITALPPEFTQLTELEEVWMHGNLIEALPEDIGKLTKLWRLSLAGNRILRLPESLGNARELRELSLSGNLLSEVPAFIGNFEKLVTLSLNGNWLERVPPEIGKCQALRFLNLQTNHLTELPDEIAQLVAVEEVNLSDNELRALPTSLDSWQACKMIWLYGNKITNLPRRIFQIPQLECIWVEGNPLDQKMLAEELESVMEEDLKNLREIGLDLQQVEGLNVITENSVWTRVRLGEVLAHSRGYFKLRRGGDLHESPDHALLPKVLVVTFASAPGTPNWGGVLNRITADAKPEEKCFDILYVCDGGRNWYSAGDDGIFFWRDRLSKITQLYSRVIMLGDSMGATGALLFSDLATAVQVFTPQVDLSGASMRPGQPHPWLSKIKLRILDSVKASTAHIQCHVGTWEHDLDQAKLLPEDKCELVIHQVDSHRLAFALNQQSKLVPTIRTAIMKELGLYQAPRLVNLL